MSLFALKATLSTSTWLMKPSGQPLAMTPAAKKKMLEKQYNPTIEMQPLYFLHFFFISEVYSYWSCDIHIATGACHAYGVQDMV